MTDTREGTRGTVVVGVDGSEYADRALRHAIDDAARRGARVHAVAAHEPPEAWAFAYGVPALADSGAARRALEEKAREWVESVRVSLPEELQAVTVDVEAVTGPPTAVLVQMSENADVLVVGHRGRGAVRSVMLGSVGLGCALHATCPVTIVPPARPAEG